MSKNPIFKKSFVKLSDFTESEIQYLVDLSMKLKEKKKKGEKHELISGKNVVLIFEKASTRTRSAFEVATFDLGAHCSFYGPSGSHWGNKETTKDSARVYARYYDFIGFRGFKQETVEDLAKYAGVPVCNGLTNMYHPTQILATFQTMIEHSKKKLKEIKFCYIGDARFNMANSLVIGAAIMGMDIRVIAPKSLQPSKEIIEEAKKFNEKSKGKLLVTESVEEGVKGVDFVYTDVWVSMGESKDVWAERIKILTPYRVTMEMMKKTGNKNAKFMHCLPAFHNKDTGVGKKIYDEFKIESMEVTDEVFESDMSTVFDEAENRLHTIKAVMLSSLVEKFEL